MARHRVRNLNNNPHKASEVEGHRQPEPTKLPYVCPFPSCSNRIFKSKSGYTKHIRCAHPNDDVAAAHISSIKQREALLARDRADELYYAEWVPVPVEPPSAEEPKDPQAPDWLDASMLSTFVDDELVQDLSMLSVAGPQDQSLFIDHGDSEATEEDDTGPVLGGEALFNISYGVETLRLAVANQLRGNHEPEPAESGGARNQLEPGREYHGFLNGELFCPRIKLC